MAQDATAPCECRSNQGFPQPCTKSWFVCPRGPQFGAEPEPPELLQPPLESKQQETNAEEALLAMSPGTCERVIEEHVEETKAPTLSVAVEAYIERMRKEFAELDGNAQRRTIVEMEVAVDTAPSEFARNIALASLEIVKGIELKPVEETRPVEEQPVTANFD